MGRKGRELTLDEKKSIISLIESGFKSAKVAEILHLTPLTISRLLKQFHERGSIENKHWSGRPRSMTVCNHTALSRIVKRDRRKTLTDITGDFNRSLPKPVSCRTIQRELHRQKYWRRTVAKKMGVREVNRKKKTSILQGKINRAETIHWNIDTVIFDSLLRFSVGYIF